MGQMVFWRHAGGDIFRAAHEPAVFRGQRLGGDTVSRMCRASTPSLPATNVPRLKAGLDPLWEHFTRPSEPDMVYFAQTKESAGEKERA